MEEDHCKCHESESRCDRKRRRTRIRRSNSCVGCGEYDSVQEATDKLVKVVDTVEPDAKLVAKYEEKYQQFREIYPALKDVFQKFD